jgi:hypothetical protein
MGDHLKIQQLLCDTFEFPKYRDDDYLSWQYDRNPVGEAWEENIERDGRLLGHFALLPTLWRHGDRPEGVWLTGVNHAIVPSERKKGHTPGQAVVARDLAIDRGVMGSVGVANELSTTAPVKYMQVRMFGGLPITICRPTLRGRGVVESYEVDEAFLDSIDFEEVVEGLDSHRVHDWAQSWQPDIFRWRLSMPTASYILHVSDDLVAVSTKARGYLGVPVASLLKLIPRPGAPRRTDAGPIVTEVCRYHRTPFTVYAGFNARVEVRGVAAPERLRPSPLNFLAAGYGMDNSEIEFDIYEFLDFDAF